MAQNLTIAAAAQALRGGDVPAVALTQACLDRIAAVDPQLRAFVTVTADRALADARRADAELHAGQDRGPLHGIPIALKDLIATAGIRTTAGSQVLADNVPSTDAPIVQALAAAGTVLVGKTNTHEFAWGVFTPPTRNPWNTERVPGGSSGGSAVAVVTGEALGAIGTDTGGSIRIPAACCGATGFKPTYGLVATEGIIPLSWSLDHAGPIARTVEDCALLLDVLVPAPHPSYAAQLPAGMSDIRLGVLGGSWADQIDPEILAAFHLAATALAPHATSIDARVPATLFHDYRMIQSPEAASYHQDMGWFPARTARYTPATRSFLERTTTGILATEHARALRRRQEFMRQWQGWLNDAGVDVVLAPTLPIAAPEMTASADPERSPALREDLLRLTYPLNMLGVPALSVPCGFTSDGLPIGMQIIARQGQDALALRVGAAFQQLTTWHAHMPA